MALTQLTADVENISKLDNYPPDDVGMTSAILKSRFDKGSADIKTFINGTLIPQLDTSLADKLSETTLTAGIEAGLAAAKASGEFDGSEIELQSNGTYIQWRYVGGSTWTNLVLLSTLKGDKGDTGATGAAGTNGTNGTNGKTAYASAVTGGYTDTEANFNSDLGAVQGLKTVLEALL